MGHLNRSSTDNSAESNMDYGNPAPELSEETISVAGLETILVIMWQRCGLCPKSLLTAKLKSNGLTSLVKEISKQHNIDSVVWLLAMALMRIYNGKSKWGKRK